MNLRLPALVGATALLAASPALAHDLLQELAVHAAALVGVDDLDGDGIADLAYSDTFNLHLVSGASGARLGWIPGTGGSFAAWVLDECWVADAGDVDGDGKRDVAVGGRVWSPASGAQVLTTSGRIACGLGDVDGDGRQDVLCGDPQLDVKAGGDVIKFYASGNGFAEVVSGATGAALWHVDGAGFADGFGGYVEPAGDVNGDGVGDALVSTRVLPLNPNGYVRLLSGADGSLLLEVPLQGFWGPNGALAGLGDVDGDGAGDFALAEVSPRRVRLLSGASGASLWEHTHPPSTQADSYAFDVRPAGDVDGDGVVDVLVHAPQPTTWGQFSGTTAHGPGYVELLSGATGQELHTFVGYGLGSKFGQGLAGVGDLDGDGLGEVALGSMYEDLVGMFSGSLRVFRGASGYSMPAAWCVGSPTPGAPLGAQIGWQGSVSAAAGSFRLTAVNAKPQAVSVFLYSSLPGAEALAVGPTPPMLCLRPPVLRLAPAQLTDASGSVWRALDLGAQGSPFAVGTTWHVQLAWREGGGFATSDALSLTVLP